MGLKKNPSNSWNSQSNAILEQIHQVLGDGLRVFDLDKKHIDENDDDPFDEYIPAVAYTIHCAYHRTHRNSPRQLLYGQDMFLPVDQKIDWEELITRKQQMIHKSNEPENSKRINHNYKRKETGQRLYDPEQLKEH